VNNELIIKKIKIYFSGFLLLIGFLFISNGTVSDDGFVHRFQYDSKDTSSLRYCFPTLKINLKVN
jgi:hypothetical protein